MSLALRILRWLGKGLGGFLFTLFLGMYVASTVYAAIIPEVIKTAEQQLVPQFQQQFEQSRGQALQVCQQASVVGREVITVNNLTINCTEVKAVPAEKWPNYALLNLVKGACQAKETAALPLGQINATMNCTQINNATTDNIISIVANSSVASLTQQQVPGCEGLQKAVGCLLTKPSEAPKLLISIFSSIRSNTNYVLLGLIAAAAILALSVWNLPRILRDFGMPFVVVGAPAVVLGYVVPSIIASLPLPPQLLSAIGPLVSNITKIIAERLQPFLILGIILIVAGIALGFVLKPKEKSEHKKH